MLRFALTALLCLGSAASALSSGDIARVWNEENLAAIRLDRPHPPVQARNLFSVSAAMYDAWAAYDPKAVGFTPHPMSLRRGTRRFPSPPTVC